MWWRLCLGHWIVRSDASWLPYGHFLSPRWIWIGSPGWHARLLPWSSGQGDQKVHSWQPLLWVSKFISFLAVFHMSPSWSCRATQNNWKCGTSPLISVSWFSTRFLTFQHAHNMKSMLRIIYEASLGNNFMTSSFVKLKDSISRHTVICGLQ